MIVIGYNGVAGARDFFASRFGRKGVDRYRVLGHDAGAALFIDGVLVAAAEEERFSRIKKDSDFPSRSIAYCLDSVGLTVKDVEAFAFPWNFSEEWLAESFADPNIERRAQNQEIYNALMSHDAIHQQLCERLDVAINRSALHFVDHHTAHVHAGLYIHNVRNAAFIVNDGRSEAHSSIMGIARDGELEIVNRQSIDDSICQFYSKLTKYLGFTPNSDEYKVMGLCGYAVEAPAHKALSLLDLEEQGGYRLKLSHALNEKSAHQELFELIFGLAPSDEAAVFDWRARCASAGQRLYEEALFHQVRHIRSLSDSDTLILEGGGALNCLANGKVARDGGFKHVRVGFGANDSGTCIGAGARVAAAGEDQTTLGEPSPYLGPAFDRAAILTALEAHGESAEEMQWSDLCARLAIALNRGDVAAWFQGRMEFGPRALGNRSILGDARNPAMRDLINSKVKYREEFRPLAPAVLGEHFTDWFESQPAACGRFMTSVYNALPIAGEKIPSAVHCDGTARVQTVCATDNQRFHDLLSSFYELTGVPCLINTSFNLKGEPIVCTPSDAIDCYRRSNIDILVLGNFFLEKN